MPKTSDVDYSAVQIETGYTLSTVQGSRTVGPIADALKATLADPTMSPSIATEEAYVRPLMNKIRNTASALAVRSIVRLTTELDGKTLKLKQADMAKDGIRVIRVHFRAQALKAPEQPPAPAAE